MKSALTAILLCVCVRVTFAGDFHSAVLTAGSSLTPDISVPANHFLRIRNFTQDALSLGVIRGTVSVKFGTSTTGVTVMASSSVNTGTTALEPINSVVIAGPATVTITAASSGNTVVTYIKEKDSD